MIRFNEFRRNNIKKVYGKKRVRALVVKRSRKTSVQLWWRRKRWQWIVTALMMIEFRLYIFSFLYSIHIINMCFVYYYLLKNNNIEWIAWMVFRAFVGETWAFVCMKHNDWFVNDAIDGSRHTHAHTHFSISNPMMTPIAATNCATLCCVFNSFRSMWLTNCVDLINTLWRAVTKRSGSWGGRERISGYSQYQHLQCHSIDFIVRFVVKC